ncbi:hypothetical protein [Sphingomonas montana]|uniref:hypothetical protein n=1 Tax=Sphingomonas montana TaxID=1843236 RepID=UPI00101AD875|nr:hypothetical protein [Sphingomonas montana]
MTRILSLVGAALPTKMIPAGRGNVTGHWEPEGIAGYNDLILQEMDSGWNDPFGPRRRHDRPLAVGGYIDRARALVRTEYGDAPLIVVKEPRVARLTEIWQTALEQEGFEVSYLIMVRPPAAVAASLRERDGIDRNKALLLWTSYMLESERATRTMRRHFVKYDDLLRDPESVLDDVEEKLGFQFPRRSWKASDDIATFVDPTLNHHDARAKTALPSAFAPVTRLYEYMATAATGILPNEDVPTDVSRWLQDVAAITAPMVTAMLATTAAERASAQLHTDALTTALANHGAALATAQQQADANAQAVREGEERIAALAADIIAQITARGEEAARYETERATLVGRFDLLEQDRQRREAEIAEFVNAAALTEQQLRAELAETTAHAARLSAMLDAQAVRDAARIADIEHLQGQVAAGTAEIMQLTAALAEDRARIAVLDAEAGAQAGALEAMTAALTTAAGDAAELNARIARYEVVIAEREAQLADAANHAAALTDQQHRLEVAHAAALAEQQAQADAAHAAAAADREVCLASEYEAQRTAALAEQHALLEAAHAVAFVEQGMRLAEAHEARRVAELADQQARLEAGHAAATAERDTRLAGEHEAQRTAALADLQGRLEAAHAEAIAELAARPREPVRLGARIARFFGGFR